MQSNHNIQPSYFGFVETRDDAVILVQACREKSLDFVPRRPTSSERPSIAQSGHVFVYEATASDIQRWTDGRHWSPSRMSGDFFIYGERLPSANRAYATESDHEPVPGDADSSDQYGRLYGPLAKPFHVGPENLVKKTIKIKDRNDSGTSWHVVSYYRPVDVVRGQLQTPSRNQEFTLQPWHRPGHSIPYGYPPNSPAFLGQLEHQDKLELQDPWYEQPGLV
jgi:hypothetical protein